MNEHIMALPLPNQICWSIFLLLLEEIDKTVFTGKSEVLKVISKFYEHTGLELDKWF